MTLPPAGSPRFGRDWWKADLWYDDHPDDLRPVECLVLGRLHLQTNSLARWLTRWWQDSHPPLPTSTCPICARRFIPQTPGQQYCSRRHWETARKRRQRHRQH